MLDVCNERSKFHVGKKVFGRLIINCLRRLMWHHVAGDINPHVTRKSIFRKHCLVKLRERHTVAFNSLAYDRWMHSDASRKRSRNHDAENPRGFRSVRRNCTWYDNRDFKKSRLFRPEVTLIKMSVNVRLFARILFQKFKRLLIMCVIIIMQRRNDNGGGIFLLAEYYMCIKNLLNFLTIFLI